MTQPWWRDACQPLDSAAMEQARARQQQLTKPAGSLGQLEGLAVQLAGLQGCERPTLERVAITIFAGDHGVVEEGISAYPQAVTGQMLRNFVGGALRSAYWRANFRPLWTWSIWAPLTLSLPCLGYAICAWAPARPTSPANRR